MTKHLIENEQQTSIYDVAVVIPTVLRPQLLKAVTSIFAQDIKGRVQILIGIDHPLGSMQVIDEIKALCPENMNVDVLNMGYSTNRKHGGLYTVWAGGSLRTALSYLANSPLIAYLDDDNWWAENHLSTLKAAISGYDWAYSLRNYVHPHTHETLGIDHFESVGPGKGIYNDQFGGFVDTNCLMINKIKCHWVLPAWSVAVTKSGTGPDRSVFEKLATDHSVASTNEATAYYVVSDKDLPMITNFLSKNHNTDDNIT